MASAPKLTGLSGNEIYCMRLKGLTPSGVVIGNSIQSMGFLGGVRSADALREGCRAASLIVPPIR
jgi:hypothetical protein